MRVKATTTLTLRIDEVSYLLGVVRNAIDEDEELVEENLDGEGVVWAAERRSTLVPLERRLVSAGRRLGRTA